MLHADAKKIVSARWAFRLGVGSSHCTGQWGSLQTAWGIIRQRQAGGAGPAAFPEKSGVIWQAPDPCVLIYKVSELHTAPLHLTSVLSFHKRQVIRRGLKQKIPSPKGMFTGFGKAGRLG